MPTKSYRSDLSLKGTGTSFPYISISLSKSLEAEAKATRATIKVIERGTCSVDRAKLSKAPKAPVGVKYLSSRATYFVPSNYGKNGIE